MSIPKIHRDLRRLEIQINRSLEELRRISLRDKELRKRAKGKSQIEKKGISREIRELRNERRSQEVLLDILFLQKAAVKNVKFNKTMSSREKQVGITKNIMKHKDHMLNLISDKGVEISDEMGIWQSLAEETDVVLDSMLQSNEQIDEIMAELEEAELEDDLEGLEESSFRTENSPEREDPVSL